MAISLDKAITGNSSKGVIGVATSTLTGDGQTFQIGPLQGKRIVLVVASVPATSITIERGLFSGVPFSGNIALVQESTGNIVTAITATGNYIIGSSVSDEAMGPYFTIRQNGAGLSIFTSILAYDA